MMIEVIFRYTGNFEQQPQALKWSCRSESILILET
jgi:hypothetical protein